MQLCHSLAELHRVLHRLCCELEGPISMSFCDQAQASCFMQLQIVHRR